MARVIFVNRFYAPDISATSQILTDLAVFLVGEGVDVHVLASDGLYNASGKLAPEETREGVKIHRVPTAEAARHNLIKRGLGYISVFRSFAAAIRDLAQPGDVVVAKTDPPMLSAMISRALSGRPVRLINWWQDIYPEIASELGVPLVGGPVQAGLIWLRDQAMKKAVVNVVLGERMQARVAARGIPKAAIRMIPNWTNDETIYPVDHHLNPMRVTWGLQDKFVLAYSGNLGRAHEYDTLLGAAALLRERRDFCFLFIGGGQKISELAKRVDEAGLKNRFMFQPYQNEGLLKYSLTAADAHWVSLLPSLEGLIVPSKFYGAAAAGRPILFVGAQDGELARLVNRFDCGAQIDVGASERLASIILRLADDAAHWRRQGQNARVMIDQHFSRQRALRQWKDLISDALAGSATGAHKTTEQVA